MKTCSKCGVPKEAGEFSKCSRSPDGLAYHCKGCCAQKQKDNPKTLEYGRKFRENNLERCRERVRKHLRKTRANDPEKYRAYQRGYYAANRALVKSKRREYRRANPEKHALAAKKWRAANPEKVRETNRRANKNIQRKLGCTLRGHVRSSLKYATSNSQLAKRLLGAPVIWLEAWLESLFRPGMTWDNHGSVWHIDHIKPCAAFDLINEEQQQICFHWTNLQPLFADENRKKSDTYVLP